jgi:hypothetical protein
MTAQATETLNYKGEKLRLCAEPLAGYFELKGFEAPFRAPHTALWRGYVGTWGIVDDRLYLVDLMGWAKSGGKVGLDFLFPGCRTRVFAHWANGLLRATRGKRIRYVHAGFGSVYEHDLLLQFHKGILKSVAMRNNYLEEPTVLPCRLFDLSAEEPAALREAGDDQHGGPGEGVVQGGFFDTYH